MLRRTSVITDVSTSRITLDLADIVNNKLRSYAGNRRSGGVKRLLESVATSIAEHIKVGPDGIAEYSGDIDRDVLDAAGMVNPSYSVTLQNEEELSNVESVLAVLRDAPSQRTDLENILVEMLYRARERRSSRIK